MFQARAALALPDNVNVDDLNELLENIGNELMIDIMLADQEPPKEKI